MTKTPGLLGMTEHTHWKRSGRSRAREKQHAFVFKAGLSLGLSCLCMAGFGKVPMGEPILPCDTSLLFMKQT